MNRKIIHDINNLLAKIVLEVELGKTKDVLKDVKRIQKLLEKLAD